MQVRSSRIQAPTLIVWRDRDDFIPLVDQQRLAGAITGSHLAVCPGVGHMVYLEAPDRVAADIVKFLQN